MGLKDIKNIKIEYTTNYDNVVTSFYIPCLKEAVEYKRAVGYFSSTILLQISQGLGALATKGGKVKLLVSPRLTEDDYLAIEKGYKIKDYVTKKLVDEYDENIEFEQKEDRFALLSYLIANNILDIKIVVLEKDSDLSIYHEKLGIMRDDEDNIISFSGSGNETYNAFNGNYEAFDVFCSWKSEDSFERCMTKDCRFDRLWENSEKGTITIPFPDVIKNKILKHNPKGINFLKLDEDLVKIYQKKIVNEPYPKVEMLNKLRDYQLEAITNWKKNNYHGIFDMATGTGKTFTACGAITKLFDETNRLFVVICCPYIHLVDQWYDEVEQFNIKPIRCYSEVGDDKEIKRLVLDFKQKRTDFACMITTNRTFQLKLQDYIQENINDTLLVVDEAHNFGSSNLRKCMEINYPYRLALSATIDRYGDEIGTKRLYDFFGKIVFTYSLEKAIRDGMLTPYKYYPIVVNLTEEERNEYYELTEKIKKFHFTGDDEIPSGLQMLLIKRARIIASASNKISRLKELLVSYKDANNLLVYCGAVKYGEYDYEKASEEKKQIDVVLEIMNKDLGIRTSRFTSEEKPKERSKIIDAYKNDLIQALVAIKCLDEGVNIPAIKTAFILASSTNPKEYIQRRGRVLRKFPGKIYAEIYDFITIPRSIDETNLELTGHSQVDRNLVERELSRVEDFASLSINPSDSYRTINEIRDKYEIDIIRDEDIWSYE